MDPSKHFCVVHGEWQTSTFGQTCPLCVDACVSYLPLVEMASKAGAAGKVEGRAEATAAIVTWLRGARARIEGQLKAGAIALHPMHTSGLIEGCEQAADAIERGEPWSDETQQEKP